MAFHVSGDRPLDMLSEKVWQLCSCANRGDVTKLKAYLCKEDIKLNIDCIAASALILATEQGQVKVLKTLIAAGADVNMSQSEHKILTPIMTAAEKGHVDCLITLLDSGARVNEHRYDGQTPLAIAMVEGWSDELASIINSEMPARIRPSMGSLVMTANRTWIEQHEECALLLLQAGAEVDYINNFGYSLFMFAAASGSIKILKALIQAGGNINQLSNDGTTALMLACRSKSLLDFRQHKECVDLLLDAGAKVDITNLDGKTALFWAVENTSQYRKKFQPTDILQLLIKAGANPNVQDKDGKTALMYAAVKDLAHFCELLINYSAEARMQDNNGKTVYMYATGTRCLQVILSTIKLKYKECEQVDVQLAADLNIQDMDGKTALIYAAESNLPQCGELLINHHCDVNLQDNCGRTALMYGSTFDLLQMLLTGLRVDHIVSLPHRVANPNIQDNNGKTALMYAAQQNLKSFCQFLIKHSADVNTQDNDGKTALMYASRRDSINALLSNGANADLLDNSGCTALVHLLQSQKPFNIVVDNVSIILDYGANPVLDPRHRHLLQIESPSASAENIMQTLVTSGCRQMIRLLVCNGFVSHFQHTWNRKQSIICPISSALKVGNFDIIKYFVSNCYLNDADMRVIQMWVSTVSLRKFKNGRLFFLEQMMNHPMPLVKLAFVAVSSALGVSPEREQRIAQTQLPARLQRMLMFQEPVSRLPVRQWSYIPLCFDPVQYERLSKPRPLLYYWPFGRDFVI